MWLFKDRDEAGEKLGDQLLKKNFNNPVILALPRGGVILAHHVAMKLKAPMDVVIARKVGAPMQPEYGLGAISEDMLPLFSSRAKVYYDVNAEEVSQVVEEEKIELRRRVNHYRQGGDLPSMENKTIIVVDDGIATGVTAAAAGRFLQTLNPEKVVLAVPLGPKDISQIVKQNFDEIICLYQPENFMGVGMWYSDFDQVEDEEVMKILNIHHSHQLKENRDDHHV